jgi:hypothetical protein
MALYHVHASVISKGQSPGGATGFAQYIAREGQEKSTQMARYVTREGATKEDLVAKGSGALPSWAEDGTHFFLMADRYERQNGVLARCYEIALPRELSADQRLELAADIRSTFFATFPHVWAMHNPMDTQGHAHPHMHLMFSERRMTDALARSPKLSFARAAAQGQDPATHGVRKDQSWQGPDRLREVRQGIATLTNAALERAGIPAAVSHASLRARGEGREAVIYTSAEEQAHVDAQRRALHRDIHPKENAANLTAWQAQKQREKLHDLSREAMVQYVSTMFWRREPPPSAPAGPSPERQATITRTPAAQRARPQDAPSTRRRPPIRAPGQGLRVALARIKALLETSEAGAALHVQLYKEKDREKERGVSW